LFLVGEGQVTRAAADVGCGLLLHANRKLRCFWTRHVRNFLSEPKKALNGESHVKKKACNKEVKLRFLFVGRMQRRWESSLKVNQSIFAPQEEQNWE